MVVSGAMTRVDHSLTALAHNVLIAFLVATSAAHQERHHFHHQGGQENVFLPHAFSNNHHSYEHEECGMEIPNLSVELGNEIRLNALQNLTNGLHPGRRKLNNIVSCEKLCDQCIEIKTYLHLIGAELSFGEVIPHPTLAMNRARENATNVTSEDFSTKQEVIAMFSANVRVLNNAFQGTPFRFKFIRRQTSYTANNEWSEAASDYKEEIGDLLGHGDFRKLDCYISETIRRADKGIVLGTATLPGSQNDGKGDGVYIRYDVLTGGGRSKNELGYTLVHEVAHWLGLLHTFQRLVTNDPCDPREEEFGDFVDDTPLQSVPTSSLVDDCTDYLGGANPMVDSCPDSKGLDAMFNFVNYAGNEECLAQEGSFTCGQVERMNRHWILYRERTKSCGNGINDMEVEVLIRFDSYHVEQNKIQLVDERGSVVFDSDRDHLVAYLLTNKEFMYLDVCLARDKKYELNVVDSGGNGFTSGSIQIFNDRSMVHEISGDFGRQTSVIIEAEPQVSRSPSNSVEWTQIPTSATATGKPSVVSSTPTPTRWPSMAPSSGRPSVQPSFVPSSMYPSMSSSPTLLPTSTSSSNQPFLSNHPTFSTSTPFSDMFPFVEETNHPISLHEPMKHSQDSSGPSPFDDAKILKANDQETPQPSSTRKKSSLVGVVLTISTMLV